MIISQLKNNLLTYVRGVANEGEEPLLHSTPLTVSFLTLIGFFSSLTIGHLILSLNLAWLDWLLLIPFATASGGAYALSMVAHLANHVAIARTRWLNRAVFEVAAIVGLFVEPERYKQSHGKHHLPDDLATQKDPDNRWLNRWGFIPGQPIDYYWRQLWKTLLNPMYYGVFFVKRLQSNFLTASLPHRLAALGYWGAVILASFFFNAWATFAFYLAVIVAGYGALALCQLLCEHRWGNSGSDPSEKTFPRFLPIDEHPERFLLYLFWRTSVLSLDLQQHQMHHSKPRNFDWPMVAYSEEAKNDRSQAIWGIKAHFNEAFRSLSKAKADE